MAENQVKDSLQQSKEDYNELVKHKTANYSLLPKTEDLWATFDNLNATEVISMVLPTAVIGDGFKFSVATAEVFKIVPASGESLANPADNVQLAADRYIFASTIGYRVEYECTTTGEWNCNSVTGTWGNRAP